MNRGFPLQLLFLGGCGKPRILPFFLYRFLSLYLSIFKTLCQGILYENSLLNYLFIDMKNKTYPVFYFNGFKESKKGTHLYYKLGKIGSF